MVVFPLRLIGTVHRCDAKNCPKIREGKNISCDACQQSQNGEKHGRKVVKGVLYVMRCPHCKKNDAYSPEHGKPYQCRSCNWSSETPPDKKNRSTNTRKWFKAAYLNKIEEWIGKAVGCERVSLRAIKEAAKRKKNLVEKAASLGSKFKTIHSENTPHVAVRTRAINTPKGEFRVNQVRDVNESGHAKRGPSFRVYAHPRGKETATATATGKDRKKKVISGRQLYNEFVAEKCLSIRDVLAKSGPSLKYGWSSTPPGVIGRHFPGKSSERVITHGPRKRLVISRSKYGSRNYQAIGGLSRYREASAIGRKQGSVVGRGLYRREGLSVKSIRDILQVN